MAGVKVYGLPAPKGSLHCVGRRACTKCGAPVAHQLVEDDSTGKGKTWRAVLETAGVALKKAHGGTITGPVSVDVTFVLPAPKTMPKGRLWPSVKPDVDKLARMLLDALTSSHVITDDARVVELTARKCYPCDACLPRPGAIVAITVLDAPTGTPALI
ncbi:MAG: RusA family crossover junction endodeoxyribonuclease [Micropruina sp.]|uniref:RusA family crossover junction endodeoxyribonuclease n=1 Tax=Micropruina sp. TaxID=2737536 RepID=UPI0039E639B6